MQAVVFRRPKLFASSIRTPASDAKAVESESTVYRQISQGVSLNQLVQLQEHDLTIDVDKHVMLAMTASFVVRPKFFESSIKRERHQRLEPHEKLLDHVTYPHGLCDFCDDAIFASNCRKVDAEELKERAKVREKAGLAKSQLQDIHEMKMIAGMMQWLWEAEVKGQG